VAPEHAEQPRLGRSFRRRWVPRPCGPAALRARAGLASLVGGRVGATRGIQPDGAVLGHGGANPDGCGPAPLHARPAQGAGTPVTL